MVKENHKKEDSKKSEKIKGFLWFIAFILVLFFPIRLISSLVDFSIVGIITSFWGLVIGIRIFLKKQNAIRMLKYLLVFNIASNIISTLIIYASFYEMETGFVLFQSIIFVFIMGGIWYYLNNSQNVKDIFKDTKARWGIVVILIILSIFFGFIDGAIAVNSIQESLFGENYVPKSSQKIYAPSNIG